MDDISNINFESNENRPMLDKHKVHDGAIFNKSSENKLSTAESDVFVHNSPLTEKQVLTTVNNNFLDGKPNISFTASEFPTEVISNISGEKISFLSSEVETTRAENVNLFSLAPETPCLDTSKSLQDNSVSKNEFNNDPVPKYAIPSSNKIPVGNVNFPPDALSDAVLNDNEKNISINAEPCNEIKDEKNNSYVVVQDMVDFSFKEQENTSGNLLGDCSAIEFLSKNLNALSLSSPNNTLEKISDDNSGVYIHEKTPLNQSVELMEINKVPKSPVNNLEESVVPVATDSCDILEHSINTNFPPGVPENLSKENISCVVSSDSTCVQLEKPSKAVEDVSVIDSGLTNNEVAFEVSENISSNEIDKISPLKIEKVSFGMSDKSFEDFAGPDFESEVPANNPPEQFSRPDLDSKVPEDPSNNLPEKLSGSDFQSKVPEDPSNNPTKQLSGSDFELKVPENPSNNLPEKLCPDFESKVPEDPSNNLLEKLSCPDFESRVLEEPSNNPPEQFSCPDLDFKVPEDKSNNLPEKLSGPEFEFKMPEIPSYTPSEQFSGSDFEFKMPEIPPKNPFGEFSDPDPFKVPEAPSNNPLEQFSDPEFAFKMPENPLTNEGDEQFVDAVQFFKDPNSFQFLENIRTSTVQPGSTVPRSSLYVNFDPLHSKFQTNINRQDNCALITAAVQENIAPMENSEKSSPSVVNKRLEDVAARQSLGNILISFDSPKSSAIPDAKLPAKTPTPTKMFTEEEVQQKLKIHELETQETYLKKQREMEMEIAKRDELLKFQRLVLEEWVGISAKLSDDTKKSHETVTCLEAENTKLKEDLKTSAEDLQSVENTFTDFYKRYEQCKGMLKTYKDNEEHLKQTISDLQAQAKEQEQMYCMLQERTEDMLEKANVEMDNVKRSGEAQVTVLKAQLKKAEMKISSLESDIKQIKIENSQLGGICDDLMAKVSQS